MEAALEQGPGEREARRGRKIALHALCFVLASAVTIALGEAIGWPIYSGRFFGGVFTLSLFFFEFVFMAFVPAIFEARRIRRVAAEDAQKETRRAPQGHRP